MNEKPKNVFPEPGNQKLLVGLVAGILIGLLIAFYFLDYFPAIGTALINFLIALFIVSVIGLLLFTWFKKGILSKLLGQEFQVESDEEEVKGVVSLLLEEQISRLIAPFPESTRNKAKSLSPKILKLGIWIFTRSWALRILTSIFIAIGGLLGAILLYNQNQLLNNQNQLLIVQNEKIQTQSSLIESERRSSLVFLMSNILDKVDEEIQNQQLDEFGTNRRTKQKGFRLSAPLLARIASLSRAFRPYRTLEGGRLSEQIKSPERGQLFISLMKSNLDKYTQGQISSTCVFEAAEIGNVVFPDSLNLQNVVLRDANLDGSRLRNANLKYGNFENSSFVDSYLSGVELLGSNLKNSNLSDCTLTFADLRGSELSGAILTLADLRLADLRHTKLSNADFAGANLKGANLINAAFSQSRYWSYFEFNDTANLSGAIFEGAVVDRENYQTAKIRGASIDGTNFVKDDPLRTNRIKNDIDWRYELPDSIFDRVLLHDATMSHDLTSFPLFDNMRDSIVFIWDFTGPQLIIKDNNFIIKDYNFTFEVIERLDYKIDPKLQNFINYTTPLIS